MPQTTKQFAAKISKAFVYLGYGKAGTLKRARLDTKAKKLNTTISKLVKDTLNAKYPDLGL